MKFIGMSVWDLADSINITGKIEIVVADEKGNIYSEHIYENEGDSERQYGKREIIDMHAVDDRIVFVVKPSKAEKEWFKVDKEWIGE